MNEDEVLVLGGGLAGLSCATSLAESGRRVRVLEGRGCLGGRAQSFRHARTGDDLDTGQHVLMGCYEEMFRLLDRVGSRHLVRLQDSLTVELREPGRPPARLRCPSLPAPLHLAAGLFLLGSLSWREKLGCVRVMSDARVRWDDDALDRLSVEDWLVQLGQSERARRCFWTPVCLATLNASPGAASASLLAVVLVRAFMAPGRASSIGLSTVGLSELYAGHSRSYLAAHGGTIELNQPAVALEVQDGRCTGVRLRDGRVARAGTIVSSLPASGLQRLLPPDWARSGAFASLELFRPSPIVSLHLWLDRRVLDVPFVGLVGTDLHWVFDREHCWGKPARGGHLISLVVSGADEFAAMPREEVLRRCWGDALAVLPEAREAQILHWEVIKERGATFRGRPGLGRHRFGPLTPLPGLLVAGDWTDTGLPATMEGACASGHAAAEAAGRMCASRPSSGSRGDAK